MVIEVVREVSINLLVQFLFRLIMRLNQLGDIQQHVQKDTIHLVLQLMQHKHILAQRV